MGLLLLDLFAQPPCVPMDSHGSNSQHPRAGGVFQEDTNPPWVSLRRCADRGTWSAYELSLATTVNVNLPQRTFLVRNWECRRGRGCEQETERGGRKLGAGAWKSKGGTAGQHAVSGGEGGGGGVGGEVGARDTTLCPRRSRCRAH